MVCEDVSMAHGGLGLLLPPLLNTLVENEDVDWQKDKEAGDGKSHGDGSACRGG